MPDEGVCNDLCSNSATAAEQSPLTQPPQKPSKPVAEHDRGISAVNRGGQGEFSEFSDDELTWGGK